MSALTKDMGEWLGAMGESLSVLGDPGSSREDKREHLEAMFVCMSRLWGLLAEIEANAGVDRAGLAAAVAHDAIELERREKGRAGGNVVDLAVARALRARS